MMNSDKFTHGKWIASTIHHNANNAFVYGENNEIICEVTSRPKELSLANAKLIAAAPQLLEALKNMIEEFDYSEAGKVQKGFISQAKQAIKSATE